jgi:hypothetical protein
MGKTVLYLGHSREHQIPTRTKGHLDSFRFLVLLAAALRFALKEGKTLSGEVSGTELFRFTEGDPVSPIG